MERLITEHLEVLATRFGGDRYDSLYGIPKRYHRYALEDFPPELCEKALGFIAGETDALYLHGKTGSRKTMFAAAVLRAWRWVRPQWPEEWRNGIFLPSYTAADVLRNFDTGQETRRGWANTPLLVLDDVGASRSTPHLAEQLLFLIERRYDGEMQTIITTNYTLAEFADAVDPRAASRLQEGLVLDLGDVDRRGEGEADHAQ